LFLLLRFWVPFAVAVEPAGEIRKLSGKVFNAACGGPEGVASKDGGHNPAGGTDLEREVRKTRRLGVLSFGDVVNLLFLLCLRFSGSGGSLSPTPLP